jgi:hypothetical protein
LRRSWKRMANWALSACHYLAGIFHSFVARFETKNMSLSAASSCGKCPRVRTARRQAWRSSFSAPSRSCAARPGRRRTGSPRASAVARRRSLRSCVPEGHLHRRPARPGLPLRRACGRPPSCLRRSRTGRAWRTPFAPPSPSGCDLRSPMLAVVGLASRRASSRTATQSAWWRRAIMPFQSQHEKSPHTVLFGASSFGSAAHWQPLESTWRIAFRTSRTSTVRDRPQRFAGRISGATSAHSASVTSAGWRSRNAVQAARIRPIPHPSHRAGWRSLLRRSAARRCPTVHAIPLPHEPPVDTATH